eukprot:scaffold966_cov415-Prasinococcus_capsulatus_cf.AAC.7
MCRLPGSEGIDVQACSWMVRGTSLDQVSNLSSAARPVHYWWPKWPPSDAASRTRVTRPQQARAPRRGKHRHHTPGVRWRALRAPARGVPAALDSHPIPPLTCVWACREGQTPTCGRFRVSRLGWSIPL